MCFFKFSIKLAIVALLSFYISFLFTLTANNNDYLVWDGEGRQHLFNSNSWQTRIKKSSNYIDWAADKLTISTFNRSSSIPKSTLLFGPYLDYGYEDEEVVVWFTLPAIKVLCSEAQVMSMPPYMGPGRVHSCPKQVRFSADLVQNLGKHKLTKTPIITVKLKCPGMGNIFETRTCVGSYGPVSLISSNARGAAKTEFRIFLLDKLQTPEFDIGFKNYGNITIELIGPIRYQFNNKVEVD